MYSASRNDFLDSLTHDVNTEEHEKERQEENKVQHRENEVQQDEDKEEGQKENEVQQEALNKAEHDELEKLNKSSCINFIKQDFLLLPSQQIVVQEECPDR